MDFSADELQQELARFDATMGRTIRRAGRGPDPVLDRLLAAHVRVLRAMLDDDGAIAAEDAADAARRAMDAAEPAAPLHMLAMAREILAAKVRRQASRAPGLRAA
ncbi:MAG: hypothetical protein ACREPE_03940 [Lysobacter sp.]